MFLFGIIHLVRTQNVSTYVYVSEGNVSFSENVAYVLNELSLLGGFLQRGDIIHR